MEVLAICPTLLFGLVTVLIFIRAQKVESKVIYLVDPDQAEDENLNTFEVKKYMKMGK